MSNCCESVYVGKMILGIAIQLFLQLAMLSLFGVNVWTFFPRSNLFDLIKSCF